MRAVNRLPLVLAAISVIVFSGVGAGAARSEAAGGKPSLALADEQPVVVTGRGFKARERVNIKVAGAAGAYRKAVTASAVGRFSATFGAADASCGPLYVSAVGRQGSRASFSRGIPPPCGALPG